MQADNPFIPPEGWIADLLAKWKLALEREQEMMRLLNLKFTPIGTTTTDNGERQAMDAFEASFADVAALVAVVTPVETPPTE